MRTGTKTATDAELEVIRLLAESDEPVMTAMDVAAEFDISQQAAHKRLSKLHEEGLVDRRKVGGRAVVWWLKNSH